MALDVLSSCRPTVLPRMAKLLRLTAPETADVLSMSSLALICEYQSPAPSMVLREPKLYPYSTKYADDTITFR
jgi:hypothetical protein